MEEVSIPRTKACIQFQKLTSDRHETVAEHKSDRHELFIMEPAQPSFSRSFVLIKHYFSADAGHLLYVVYMQFICSVYAVYM